MTRYRKLIAAVVGFVAVLLAAFGIDQSPDNQLFGIAVDQVVAMVAAVLGALGVWGFSNDPPVE